MRNIFELIKDYVLVPKCGGCRERMEKGGRGLCEKCARLYIDERDEFCDFCGFTVSACTCVPKNLFVNGCIDYRKLIFYKKAEEEYAVRNMIYSIKRSYNTLLVDFFAEELYKIDEGVIPENAIVTFAPRSKSAIKEYGYDQGMLLAKSYAKISDIKFETVLIRNNKKGQTQQKLLNYSQRAANVKGSFELISRDAVKGKHVILLDDVVTSGATLGECVAMLFSGGAKSVSCRSIAQTYRENKRKND